MSCKYTVRFAPDSLTDFQDFIVVESQSEELLVVPIEGRRPPPILTLPRILDCGYCLVGGVKFVEFLCQNVGLSPATFCIIPKQQWPISNLRSVSRTFFSEQPPFAVSPSLFALQPGEATIVEVVFFPTIVEKMCQVFTVVCDNCQVKDISVQGEGQMIALELISVSGEWEGRTVGELHDHSAEDFVRFGPCNPNSLQRKKIVIRNNVHLELPFHWQIVTPKLQAVIPDENTQSSHVQFLQAPGNIFSVSPQSGLLAPCQDHEFVVTFWPKELKEYHSACNLVILDVPQFPSESSDSDNGVFQPVSNGSKVSNVIAMEVEVKGSTEPYKILLEPYGIVIPGELYICTTTRKQFKMWNHSKTCIFFQWERMNSNCHVIEVVPPTGQIEENECFDFDLIVTGGKPEKVVTSLVCYIEHHFEPVTLPLEVCFKGPTVTISVPSVDFGLLRLGEQCQTTLLLINTTPLEASWALQERHSNQKEKTNATQISVEPCKGVLPPLNTSIVDIFFRPRFCQELKTELELTVESGTGCHLSVEASVQSPQVCLLNCELLLSEVYLGISTKATVTLFNQTLLPSKFNWTPELQGKQASLCEATFEPICGTLGPNSSSDITIKFTPQTKAELTEVAAICEVEGMKSPLVLRIMASPANTLSVSYSMDTTCCQSDQSPSPTFLLDFGDDVILKKGVTRHFKITNQTAIPAPFTIAAEYFHGCVLKSNSQSQKRSTYAKKPLHSVQGKKIEEKTHNDFVSSLLANGKGAAFFVMPDNGKLEAFQTLTVEVTAYTDMWGEYTDKLLCKVGDLEPKVIPMQMTVKGCPLYFQMIGPRQDDQFEGPIVRFGTHVSGGDTVSRCLRINNPTMFDIRLDWRTYNIDKNDHKLVDLEVTYGEAFPVKDIDGNIVCVRPGPIPHLERDQTPDSVVSSSSLESLSDTEEEECIIEEDTEKTAVACSHLYHANKKIISVRIRPHVGNLSDYPFCITPQQIVIPAKGSGTIHVSFTPLTLSGFSEAQCVGKALGFISLYSEAALCVPGKVGRIYGLDLEPVRINLQAVVKPAALSVQMEEDEGVLDFHASAGDLVTQDSDSELRTREFDITKSFRLHNPSEMPLHFRLKTQPPFLVLKPQPKTCSSPSSNPSTGGNNSLMLQPQKTIKVKVAFHCSLSLLDHVDGSYHEKPVIKNSKGERKLRFKKTLLIDYSNGSTQTVPLCASLYIPTLSLSIESQDFGFCFIGKTQTKEVKLFNRGAKTYWSSLIDGDSQVFRVTPDFGSLGSKDVNSASHFQCLQISFTPSEDRQFKAMVTIRSPLVKTPLVICLKGSGSFDEGCSTDQI